MPYTPDPTDATHPTTGEKASTAAAEFAALKGYIQSTVLPLITAKLPIAGGALTGLLSSNQAEAIRIKNDTGFISIWNAANSTRTGFLLGTASTSLILATDTNLLQLTVNSVAYNATPTEFAPNDTATRGLGTSAKRWATIYGTAINVTADITAATFHGDGSALTGVTGSGVTSGQIVTALGYTPYNAANPSSYISGINSGMVTAALGFTPYNASNPSSYITGINKSMVDTAVGVTTGSNAAGARTVSTSAPSGGSDGDIWLQV